MFHWKKFSVVFLLVSLFSAVVYITTYKPYLGCDDAYIYFVYVKNFVHGYGFVYNPGGEKVEGFTSLLWVLIASVFYLVSSHFQVLLIILNIFLVSYALYRIVEFIDKYYVAVRPRIISLSSILFLFILFIIKGYLDWTVFSLMESGLWSCLLILLSVFLLEVAAGEAKTTKQNISFSVITGLLVITRPESFLWGFIFLFIYGILFYRNVHSVRAAFKLLTLPLIFFIVCIMALVSFRMIYFGYPFPNTYYAKVSSDKIYNLKEGIVYIAKFVFVYPFYFISIVIAFLYIFNLIYLYFKDRNSFFRIDRLLSIQYVNTFLILISLVIPIVNGGDHFSLFRLFQPVIPLFLLPFFNPVFINYVKSFTFSKPAFSTFLLVIVLIPFIYLVNMPKYLVNVEKTPYKLSLLNDFSFADLYKKESIVLNQFFDFNPKPSIGRIWAGGYAFTYDGATVDLMGLNNTIMAHAQAKKVGLKNHAAFNKDAFYKLNPDLLNGERVADTSHFELPENKPDFNKSFEYEVFKGIFDDDRFKKTYTPVIISKSGDQFHYFTYVRNDYIDSLRNHNMQVDILKRTAK